LSSVENKEYILVVILGKVKKESIVPEYNREKYKMDGEVHYKLS